MLVSCCEVRAVDYGFLVANKKVERYQDDVMAGGRSYWIILFSIIIVLIFFSYVITFGSD